MTNRLELTVINPVERLLEVQETEWVHVRLSNGTGITLYPGHAPLLAETQAGPLRYADTHGEHAFIAEAGILSVRENKATVFTGTAPRSTGVSKEDGTPEARRFDRLVRALREELDGVTGGQLAELLSGDNEQA